MDRSRNIKRLETESFDVCIIGAGASGAGSALDASLRGLKVALVEKSDFAAETSSKSTKLIHGGVRYLEQAFMNFDFAQLRQVKHGLAERQTVIRLAPHLAHPLPLLTPVFSWFEGLYFTIGLKLYDFFATKSSFPKSRWLSKKSTLKAIPTLDKNKLHSAVMYYDGQLDDARYSLALVKTAHDTGAAVANYVEIISFETDRLGKIRAAKAKNILTGKIFDIQAKLFINCTGVFSDSIRKMGNPNITPRIRPSKGVHITLPFNTLNSEMAMLIPKTKDGRVVFAIPFENEVILGTTDTDYHSLSKEPIVEQQEVDFLLETLTPYLTETPKKENVKAGFGGLRPLIASASPDTKSLLRDHEVEFDEKSQLISLLGGKWTTYRLMAQETIDKVCEVLDISLSCKTAHHLLDGAKDYNFEEWKNISAKYGLASDIAQHLLKKYGSNATKVADLILVDDALAQRLSPNYPFIKAEVVHQVKHEMACTIRDILARRMRLELLDWNATLNSIPSVARLMALILNWSAEEEQNQINTYRKQLDNFIQSAVGKTNVKESFSKSKL